MLDKHEFYDEFARFPKGKIEGTILEQKGLLESINRKEGETGAQEDYELIEENQKWAIGELQKMVES